MKFAAIADWADSDDYPVTVMCRELGVSTSGYYDWRNAEPSARAKTDAELVAIMRKLHADARGNPGVRRMRAELAAAGHRLGLKRVWRLMRVAGLRGRRPRACKRTTIAGNRPVRAPDLIGRRFTAEAPDHKWCGDVTYIKTWDGWAYLATVIDLHSRRLVGWAVADHMRTSLVTDALDMAVAIRNPSAGVIFHSDRGAQYTSGEFDAYCRRNDIRRSLGRTGICYDNAVAESTSIASSQPDNQLDDGPENARQPRHPRAPVGRPATPSDGPAESPHTGAGHRPHTGPALSRPGPPTRKGQ